MVCLFFVLVAFIEDEGGFDWEKSKYFYSFESDFNKYEGIAESCSYISTGTFGGLFTCGDLTVSKFLTKYCENKSTDSICHKISSIDTFVPTRGIPEYSPDVANIANGIKYKLVYHWDWKTITTDILVLIAIIIGWIALLKYGIYKAILYIVYGRN